MDDNPPRPAENLPRPKELAPRTRGARAGKSARRKREAWQRWVFAQEENSGRFADPDSVPFLRPDGSTRPKLRLPRVKPWSQGEEANIEVVSDEEEEVGVEAASSSSARATLPPKPKYRAAPVKASGAVPADTSPPSGAVPVKVAPSKASGAVPVKAFAAKASGAVPEDADEEAAGAGPVLIPKAAGVAGYHRLNLPPAPIRPLSRPTTSLRPSPAKEGIPEPKTPPRDSTYVVTVPKKKSRPALPKVPKEPSYPPPPVPKEPSYPPPAVDRELDFVGLRALACDHQGQVIKVKASQLQGCKGIISWDFHRVLDRDYKDCTDWRAPGLPWRNQQLLKRLHEQIRQGQILSIVLSYCHAEDTRLHVLNSVATACEEVFGQTGFTPVDLIVLTDKATGRIGKLAAIKLLSKGEIPVLHLDDSVEVVSELVGHRNITPIHIAVPRRGRTEYPSAPVPSFSSPCDAEETVSNFIQRCID